MSGPRRDDQGPSGGQPTFTFNVGTVHGSVYNVVGDVYVGTAPVPAREIPGRLRDGLRHTAMAGSTAQQARDCIDEIDTAMRPDRPDRPRIATALERLTRLLSTAGTLAAAGTALIDPMTGLAVWLGALGKAVLDELPKT